MDRAKNNNKQTKKHASKLIPSQQNVIINQQQSLCASVRLQYWLTTTMGYVPQHTLKKNYYNGVCATTYPEEEVESENVEVSPVLYI